MTHYYGVIGNRDYIKLAGEKRPFWEFLDCQPDGWLTSLVYMRDDLPPRNEYKMVFDCGAWSYRNDELPHIGKTEVTPEWALGEYLKKAAPGDFGIAPDHMLIPGVDIEARRIFNRNSARLFLAIAHTITPMATVHGEDIAERVEKAQEYAEMGYTALALGGLAARASQKSSVIDMVAKIRESVPGIWLHVLGLSSPDYFAAWTEFGIQACDGSSHFKQAFTGGTFFTEQGGKLIKHKAAKTERGNPDALLEEIVAPLCDCKACSTLRQDGVDTRTYGSNEHNMGRAAHNLNMLMHAQKAVVNGSTVLVSCVGEKLDHGEEARNLYQSDWFKKARMFAEKNGSRWFILSAKHGLISPEKVIVPYDVTLNDMSAEKRKEWAHRVVGQILRCVPRGNIVILAGKKYRENILEPLKKNGYHVEVPMLGLGIGQQLAWLNKELTQQLNLF